MSEDINRLLEIDSAAATSAPEDSTGTPEKIGGWLILPAFGLIVGGILSLVGIVVSLDVASELPGRYQGIFALNLLFDVGLSGFLVYAAIRFFGKRRNAPATMIALMVAGVLVNGLLLLINIGADAGPFAVESGTAMVRGAIGAAIWIPYFLVSKRVKRTFVVR